MAPQHTKEQTDAEVAAIEAALNSGDVQGVDIMSMLRQMASPVVDIPEAETALDNVEVTGPEASANDILSIVLGNQYSPSTETPTTSLDFNQPIQNSVVGQEEEIPTNETGVISPSLSEAFAQALAGRAQSLSSQDRALKAQYDEAIQEAEAEGDGPSIQTSIARTLAQGLTTGLLGLVGGTKAAGYGAAQGLKDMEEQKKRDLELAKERKRIAIEKAKQIQLERKPVQEELRGLLMEPLNLVKAGLEEEMKMPAKLKLEREKSAIQFIKEKEMQGIRHEDAVALEKMRSSGILERQKALATWRKENGMSDDKTSVAHLPLTPEAAERHRILTKSLMPPDSDMAKKFPDGLIATTPFEVVQQMKAISALTTDERTQNKLNAALASTVIDAVDKYSAYSTPGWILTPGFAPPVKDAAKFRVLGETVIMMREQVEELRELIKTYGTYELGKSPGSAVIGARMQQLSNQILQGQAAASGGLAKTSDKDMKIIKGSLATAGSIVDAFQWDAAALAKLEGATREAEVKLELAGESLGYVKAKGATPAAQRKESQQAVVDYANRIMTFSRSGDPRDLIGISSKESDAAKLRAIIESKKLQTQQQLQNPVQGGGL